MNTIRMLAIIAAVALIGAVANAEDKKADNAKLIVGKWEITKTHENGMPKGTIVEFSKDGKITLSGEREGQAFKLEAEYKVDGDKFTIIRKEGDKEQKQEITIKKLNETTLATVNPQGNETELTRKK